MGKVGIMGRWGSLVFVPLQYTPPFVGFLVWYFGLSPWHIWTLLNVEIKEQSRGRVASKQSVIFSDISRSLSFKESIITPGHVLWLFFCLSYIQLVNYLPFTTWPTFHPSKHAYRAQQTGKSDLPLLDEEGISERLADFDATTENSQYQTSEESFGVLLAVVFTPWDNHSLPYLGLTADMGSRCF